MPKLYGALFNPRTEYRYAIIEDRILKLTRCHRKAIAVISKEILAQLAKEKPAA